MPDSPVPPKPFLDGWRTVLGSFVTAMGGAVWAIDWTNDSPKVIAGKLLVALGGWLTMVGLAGKSDKSTAATKENTLAVDLQTKVIASTPVAVPPFKLSTIAKDFLATVSAGVAVHNQPLADELAALAK